MPLIKIHKFEGVSTRVRYSMSHHWFSRKKHISRGYSAQCLYKGVMTLLIGLRVSTYQGCKAIVEHHR